MALATINPDPATVHLEAIHPHGDTITLRFRTYRPVVDCPDCYQPTDCVHSWYQRILADLPWHGLTVHLELHTRRWRCHNPTCPREIFTERLPELVAPSARRTNRLATVVDAIAMSLGGEAGARLLDLLGVDLSPDTLLNRLRFEAPVASESLRVLGIDDWSWRRGQRFGTILVDLEHHRVVDLLPDREAATIAAWLQRHPELEVIARDRGDAMIEAATTGAPQARQVADRWHLLHNLIDPLEEWLLHHWAALRQAAEALRPVTDAADEPLPTEAPGPLTQDRPRTGRQRAEEVRQARHARIVVQYEAIRRLHTAGADVADIARTVGVSRRTVYRYRQLEHPPERKQPRPRRTRLTAFIPTLLKRWTEGCHNGMQLWRELRDVGCTASATTVSRFVAQLRRDEATG